MFPLRSAWLPAFGACFPSGCAVCGRWPALPAGKPVCTDCAHAFANAATRCPRCALAMPQGHALCTECATHPSPLTACIAAVDYVYPWQGLIHRFKFAHQPSWAHWFADTLWQQPALRQLAGACAWWIPIPLTADRLGERGYNQAWELTKALHGHAMRTGHTHDAMSATLRHDVLMKVADTTAQHTLNRAARLANLRAAYAVRPTVADALVGKSVLLVDDVMTTGATLHATARTLLQAGAASVSAVVFARTPAPEADSTE
ncbi:MAG: ComF family protein [Burkholderiales bacterium]|nr:ComF family protein [Burkholderiales bacterium]